MLRRLGSDRKPSLVERKPGRVSDWLGLAASVGLSPPAGPTEDTPYDFPGFRSADRPRAYGLWLHLRSREGSKQRFERRGHQVLAPPGRAGLDLIRSCTSSVSHRG
jgi:hypothetical protein